ncbi:MAG: hypothetical protein JEZ12_21960 [Desulfobacterium sp.]|nr:hypothetical protein [Desulfobacterium sp.]
MKKPDIEMIGIPPGILRGIALAMDDDPRIIKFYRLSVTTTYSENPKNANDKIRWTRASVSQKFVDFETRNPIFSQRDFA